MQKEEDLIAGKLEPYSGCIKSIYIDDILSEKYIYDGIKWHPVCKYRGCNEDPYSFDLCEVHRNLQLQTNVDGQIIVRNNRKYRWTINEWKPICSKIMCDNPIQRGSSIYCKHHSQGLYSSRETASRIFNMCKKDIEFQSLKKKKENA